MPSATIPSTLKTGMDFTADLTPVISIIIILDLL